MSMNRPDLYEVDALLSSEERMARDAVRGFVEREVLPTIAGQFERGEFDSSLPTKLGAMGLLGSTLDGYGLPGMDAVAYGLTMMELERGDSGVRSFASVQGALVMTAIHAFGSDEQKERWLPPLGRGEAVACFGLTEPDFGSNPAGMRTRAEKTSAGFLLNGTKRWISNGHIADVALVWGKIDGCVRGFLVERGVPGFSTKPIKDKFSLRASATSDLILEDAEVPASAMLPGVEGMRGPLTSLSHARYGVAWGAVGAAEACYECALEYAKNRVQFSKPIAGYQLTQNKLVDMLQEITKAQLICLRLGRLKEQGRVTSAQLSLAKRNNVYHALRIARTARDILGAGGITYEYPVARHLLNLESVFTYEGTHDIHTLILGKEITGLAAFE